MAASRFFTASLLLHAIVVLLLGSAVLLKNITEDDTAFAPADGAAFLTPEPPREPSANAQVQPVAFEMAVPTPSANLVPLDLLLAPFPSDTGAKLASAPVPTPSLGDLPQLPTAPGITAGPRQSVGALDTRMDARMRDTMIRSRQGSKAAEEAVLRGLRWLVKHQHRDGSWSSEHKSAMTGFALLCFLGRGELQDSPEFGDAVGRGVDWLLARGHEFQGRFSLTRQGWGGNAGVYAHAIATYALAEYRTMSRDERADGLLRQAVAYIVDGQAPDGGWQYSYEQAGDSDTSVTGWQVQALKAAHLTGLNFPGVDEALDRSMKNFRRVQRADGGFGYKTNTDGNGYSLSGVGSLCTLFWEGKGSRVVRDGINNILDKSAGEFPVKYAGEKADLYAWYYHTQACLMYGDAAWRKWNGWFQDEVVGSQSADGSWPPTAGKSPGGELLRKADGAGPVYRTALCVLMLESYYRYMPSTRDGSPAAKAF